MQTAQAVSVEEYLHSSYEPDAEYVEGRVISRAMPQKPHSRLQRFLLLQLSALGNPLGLQVWPEQRIQVSSAPRWKFRVPDLCVTVGEPDEDIFRDPPFLCVEILSPDDSALELMEKIREYLRFGVAFVWIVDPNSRSGEVHTAVTIERVDDGIFRAGQISIDIRSA